MIQLREIIGPEELDHCRALRRTVFIEEQRVPEAEEWDGLDQQARHWLAFDGDMPVATMRLRVLAEIGKIERVCVLRSHRGRGLGAELIKAALAVFRDLPEVNVAKLGAQMHAIPFYEGLGFAAYGPEYMDGGIPHRDMKRDL